MEKRKGRPFSENKKDSRVYVRFDNETLKVLDECKEILNTSRSDIIRQGIYLLKEKIENGQ